MTEIIEKRVKITHLDQLNPDSSYTYSDYLTWKFKERVELINGKIYQMETPARYHQGISRQICGKFFTYFDGKPCKFYNAPFDVRLYDKRKSKHANRDIYTVIQPDICVICDPSKLDDKGCLGSPDLIVEILSPGNSKKEIKIKHELYEENGVREYWIVSPAHEYISRLILQSNGKYAPPQYFFNGEDMTAHIFPDLVFPLDKIFIP
jgi:Uma2 family endonuclease